MKNIIILFITVFSLGTASAQSNGFEVIKNLELLDMIYLQLDKLYVDEPQPGNLAKVGIDAMLKELDPYTVYYHEANIEDYRMMTTGQYGGIGALIRKADEFVIIAEPYQENPAAEAGLKAGDKILMIDGKDMKGKPSDEVSKALKGTKGSKVEITYDRPFEGEGKVTVTRAEIKLPDVPYFGMVNENIGYIKLNSFTKTASANVIKAFEDLKNQGMDKLVFDLRGNGGGLLNESVNIVNMFVPKGQTVVTTKARVTEENRVYRTRQNPKDLEIPIVCLIDGGSASASEIVSGTLQDLDRAVIVGNTSYGKGLVQRTVDLKYGSKMKLTIAKYYTPSGRCVQKLDYYDNKDGNVEEVPDSLIKTFYTTNGRPVIDGRGIEPDVTVEQEDMSRLTAVLIGENIIFDYATQYVHDNKSIAEASQFKLSDADYNKFVDFAMKKEFTYSTASEELLKRMKKVAEAEGYYADVKSEYEEMLSKVTPSKDRDLKKFKSQIIDILQNEIVSRYYFQSGRAENAFQEDDALNKAVEILKNESKYNSLLK